MNLMKLFEGYVRNYHRFGLSYSHGRNSRTVSEIEYFTRLGLMLGYWSFTEDTLNGTYRPMDLTWWDDYDPKSEEWGRFVLHLEKENSPSKRDVTLEKLFSLDRGILPENAIGILQIRKENHIDELLKKALDMCKLSNTLLIFRLNDSWVKAYLMENGRIVGNKTADITCIHGNIAMYFPEEHP